MIIVEDLIDLALIYLDNKMPVKALEAFQSLVDVFPDSPQGHYGLGLVYEQLGKSDLAEEAYLEAVKRNPAFAQAYFNIALLADDNNDEKKPMIIIKPFFMIPIILGKSESWLFLREEKLFGPGPQAHS